MYKRDCVYCIVSSVNCPPTAAAHLKARDIIASFFPQPTTHVTNGCFARFFLWTSLQISCHLHLAQMKDSDINFLILLYTESVVCWTLNPWKAVSGSFIKGAVTAARTRWYLQNKLSYVSALFTHYFSVHLDLVYYDCCSFCFVFCLFTKFFFAIPHLSNSTALFSSHVHSP